VKDGHGLTDVMPRAWAESLRFQVVVRYVVFLPFSVEGASRMRFFGLRVHWGVVPI